MGLSAPIRERLRAFFQYVRRSPGKASKRRPRLETTVTDAAVYVIGDVHGCLHELLTLEKMIFSDAKRLTGKKLMVMLGDYIDKGPASAQVVEHLLTPCKDGFERICLTGNHDMAMVDYFDGHLALSTWMQMGGNTTLTSYGIDVAHLKKMYPKPKHLDQYIRSNLPTRHIDFLRSLPIVVKADDFVFVHAGVRPTIALQNQRDEDLVFIRDDFFNDTPLLKYWVIHGHTPVEAPDRQGRRLNIDTGAYYSGKLTALRIWKRHGTILVT